MKRIAFVTGATGFIGRRVVEALLREGVHVRAGVHTHGSARSLPGHADCHGVEIDISDFASLVRAMQGADTLYHFAAAVTSLASAEHLRQVNADGTQCVWEAAVEAGVRKALYCSSTAVYGLLARNGHDVTEDVHPRAVEPYGRSKLLGERIAREIGAAHGIDTLVIRPAAVFGPGEHTHFGQELRNAAVSRILLAAGFQSRRFNFVHVEDVAGAAVHVMHLPQRKRDVYNVVVEPSISYEDAFQEYTHALKTAGPGYMRQRMLARLSILIERFPHLAQWLRSWSPQRAVFDVWRPGFDMTFSSAQLRDTAYQFRWTDFSAVLRSSMEG